MNQPPGLISLVAERRIARGLAENLALLVGRLADTGVPVDLTQIAESLGVVEITTTNMVEDGRTAWIEGSPRIELRADRPPTRMRFTLAHEIAHVLIERDQSVVRRTQALDHDDVEMLCDWIAASILMPRSWMRRFVDNDHYNLSLIRLIAHKAEVSLSAATVRLAEVGGRTCALLRLQRSARRWLVIGYAAVPTEYHARLEITPETSAAIDRLVNRRDTWHELTLTASGKPVDVRAHLDRAGETCLALVTSFRARSATPIKNTI